jgi:hypothetical protein
LFFYRFFFSCLFTLLAHYLSLHHQASTSLTPSGPAQVEIHERETAGTMMSFVLLLGLLIGAMVAIGFDNMI